MKVLFNKKENALVQMADGSQAQLGEWGQPRQERQALGLQPESHSPTPPGLIQLSPQP